MKFISNLFRPKNKALENAKKLLLLSHEGQLKAQQDMDWAESMRMYHTMRAESLTEFIAKMEALDKTAAPAKAEIELKVEGLVTGSIPEAVQTINAVQGKAEPAFREPRSRRMPTGGLVEA